MRKTLFFTVIAIFLFANIMQKTSAIPNPWMDCGDDISCGAKCAGFNFPLRVENYSVRAMKDMMQITFPFGRKREVIARKAQIFDGPEDENGIKDISGDYNKYPVNKSVKLKNGVVFNTRGEKNKFYVVNFAAESGYYSFMCDKGLKLKDIQRIYNMLEEAEAPRFNYDETDNYTIEQLQDLRRVDDIVEPVYTQDCFPRTLQKKGVTKDCFERANLGQDSFCSLSEIKMIKQYYKKGQDKDPLNDGSGNFCAK